MLSDVIELIVCDPEVLLLPDQSPDAEHELALVLDQFSVVEPLLATLVLLADRDTVGADAEATFTLTV